MECLICGTAYFPRAQQLYCSAVCRRKASNQRDYARHRAARIEQERARRAKRRKPRETLLERLDRWSIPEPNSGCRLWLGAVTDSGGYPIIRVRGKNLYAHRVAYELAKGPIPAELEMMHACDTPSCIALAHLSIGTHRENEDAKKARAKRWPGAR
jgi:HNH endonuclease